MKTPPRSTADRHAGAARRRGVAALALLSLMWTGVPVRAEPLQVLHWWTSTGERRAADVLVARLAQEGVEWRDAGIAGGAGVGAGKVLKSRVLAGNSPEVMQLIGYTLGEWSDLGLLLQLDSVAASNNWRATMYPTVWGLLQNRGHTMGVPAGIHRINTLFYNRKIFQRLGLAVPRSWSDFERVAATLRQAGITPLAQSSEAWQVATLFETLVLAESGPAYYRALFVDKKAEAYADPRLRHALQRLRSLKQWMAAPLREQSWPEMARQVGDGEAAMYIMGDWAKGELNAWGRATDEVFGCVAAPDTGDYHLYSIDTLAMFASDYTHQGAQEKLAQVVASPSVQLEYSQVKGSIPALRQADLSRLDSCGRASAQAFARGAAFQAPSLVHRMATDETSKDAIIAEVHRYFLDETISAADAQRRIGSMLQVLNKKGRDHVTQNPGR
ncbi:putative sugar-binding periplasmic protein precursor [Janthinobacterium sp. HH107]|uniref:ABC transporter substrate-binding protein n=1 Tax=Janthinobacterium sp. HH107 TaxID=1537279 RepID=UPI0008934BB7|nr:ABC transporter substrate-binding protein [Janthinobacterium sp. HH107]OEZ98304.1 putative sugar-binding periplasmic protein precursor [Janthinobacterium sp. HH107]